MTETTALGLAFGAVYAGLAAYALFLFRAGRDRVAAGEEDAGRGDGADRTDGNGNREADRTDNTLHG